MSGDNYQQYSGNPYGAAEAGYGANALNPASNPASNPAPNPASNPYGSTGYGSSNPYGGGYDQPQQSLNMPPLQHQGSQRSQTSQYSNHGPPIANAPPHTTVPHTDVPLAGAYAHTPMDQHGTAPLSQQDFLQRIDGAKQRIGLLTSDIQAVANIHQRMLSSPDNRSSAELESIVSQTQIRNTQIKDEIKFLERDAAREPNNSFKRTQVESLKRTFKKQLEDFQKEESDYSKRYREAIARQYRIINPEATEEEVQEAANADWGDEGVFTQALKSNRSGQASSVLGAVRARHNDIQRIEKTMSELALLFVQLNEQVVYQEEQVVQTENDTVQVNQDSKQANEALDKGIASARRARRLKWWSLLVFLLIVIIIGLAVGLYFYFKNKNDKAAA